VGKADGEWEADARRMAAWIEASRVESLLGAARRQRVVMWSAGQDPPGASAKPKDVLGPAELWDVIVRTAEQNRRDRGEYEGELGAALGGSGALEGAEADVWEALRRRWATGVVRGPAAHAALRDGCEAVAVGGRTAEEVAIAVEEAVMASDERWPWDSTKGS